MYLNKPVAFKFYKCFFHVKMWHILHMRELNCIPMYQFVSNFHELSLEDKFIVLISYPYICTFPSRASHDMLIKCWTILYK